MYTVFFLILLILVASTAYAANQGAPWVPTKKRDIARVLDLVKMRPGESFFELGCGDARLSIEFEKRYGVKTTGIELSIPQLVAAWIRNRLLKTHVRLLWKNMFKVDLSEADVVYLFLMPETIEKLKPKLSKELKSGARVVSYVFPFKDWKPEEILEKTDKDLAIYLYRI
jgi:SAM-dependent methyltransferase